MKLLNGPGDPLAAGPGRVKEVEKAPSPLEEVAQSLLEVAGAPGPRSLPRHYPNPPQ
jgi:hypothetical protein